ncbi:MAG TPA: hypothetical protein VII66_10905 [Gemmatimonadaceae bacterium]
MTKRRKTWLSGLTLAAAVGMAACSKPATPSADLSRDLDAASSASSLTLAPTAGRRDVVSAVEQSPEVRRAPAPARAAERPSPAPQPAVAVTPQPVTPPPTAVVAVAPATAAPAIGQATASRRPMPMQQAPRGGYKTEAEVFRNAPFPITP